MPLTRDQLAQRAALELRDGFTVNLGIGIPTLVANFIPESMDVLRASNVGSPVTLADNRSAPAIAYFEAARRLKGEALPVAVPGEKRSFFGKIFGRKAA